MIRLLGHELKKILSGVVLWVFVILCIAFNIWTMPIGFNPELDTTTPFPVNVFENHNTSEIAETYISMFNLTGRVAERMRVKYDTLQSAVNERAVAGESYSPYWGEYTYFMHLRLFDSFGIMGKLLFQGILLAILVTLLCVDYEKTNNTEYIVYATKTGRHILQCKIVASLIVSIGLYVLLSVITLAIYFTIFDFSSVWSSSVSSGFNFINDIMSSRPFITWHSFTVASYLLASFGLGLALVVSFMLMSVIVATLSKNAYIGFLTVLLINGICIFLSVIISRNHIAHYIANHTPIMLWLNADRWFTDGQWVTLWRNFELWGAGISLAILLVLCILFVKKFEKRSIV